MLILVLHLATNSVIFFLLLLDSGVIMTPKRRFLSLSFACHCRHQLLNETVFRNAQTGVVVDVYSD